MKKGRHDQRQYDPVQQHLPGLILNTILRIVEDLGDPYRAKPGLGGMTAYPPKAMAVVCILMEAEARHLPKVSVHVPSCSVPVDRSTWVVVRRGLREDVNTYYRKMVGHPGMNRGLAMKIGLPKIPSKSTIWRAYGMIPEPYLREVHTRIIGDVMVTGSVAGDSTGYSSNRFVRWFSIRHDQVRLKRGWVKLHSTVDVSTRIVLDCLVTDGYASDVAGMWPMPGRIEEGTGLFCPDAACPARKIYDVIVAKGMTSRIRPKSNTVCRNGGSQARVDMTRTHRDGPARFMDEYRQRSIIEAVFGAIKRMYGNHLRSRRRARQSREIAIRAICYNIEVVARKKRQAHVRVARCNGGLVRNSPDCLDAYDTINDPRFPTRGNEQTQQTGRILAVL